MARPVTIVGGGLAGLTLGIGLRQLGVPVVLHEAGTYPRHRVCGEFISGRGQTTLSRLGLDKLLGPAGAISAETAAFFTPAKATPPRPLPSAAICLSRYALDALLAKAFRELGGELREDHRWTGDFGAGIVRATGRQAQTGNLGARWFGLKIHGRNIALAADLEMHVLAGGYVGLCKINGGEVNICGLFRKQPNETGTPKNWRERLSGRPGSPLHQLLVNAEFDEDSFCAVAGLALQPQRAAGRTGICLGDTITMIPPFTGNGMSMAFESAELAITPLADWSRGGVPWDETCQKIARQCDTAFARRLAWAKWLQRIILTPVLQNRLATLATHSNRFWRLAFDHTR